MDTFTDATPSPADAASPPTGLRWIFKRDSEVVICELSLSPDHGAYELRIQPPWNPAGISLERFDDAVAAFQRHTTIERILLNEGWSLDAFEAQRPLQAAIASAPLSAAASDRSRSGDPADGQPAAD